MSAPFELAPPHEHPERSFDQIQYTKTMSNIISLRYTEF